MIDVPGINPYTKEQFIPFFGREPIIEQEADPAINQLGPNETTSVKAGRIAGALIVAAGVAIVPMQNLNNFRHPAETFGAIIDLMQQVIK